MTSFASAPMINPNTTHARMFMGHLLAARSLVVRSGRRGNPSSYPYQVTLCSRMMMRFRDGASRNRTVKSWNRDERAGSAHETDRTSLAPVARGSQ
jgi:hypothetical protein